MIKELNFLKKIFESKIDYNFNTDYARPWHVIIYPTYTCQLRCKTCDFWAVYKRSPKTINEELDKKEYEFFFKKFGFIPYISIVGGEPFLKKDFSEICRIIIQKSKPLVLAITTNGFSNKKIIEETNKIVGFCNASDVKLSIQLSVDGYRDHHNFVKGKPGSFENLKKTYFGLQRIKGKNKLMSIGLQSTLSKYNMDTMISDYSKIKNEFQPESYGVAIAEKMYYTGLVNKSENNNKKIGSSNKKQKEIMAYLVNMSKNKQSTGVHNLSNLSNLLRRAYYLSKGNNIDLPCFAGISSFVLDPMGNILPCPLLKRKEMLMGNIRDFEYDYKKMVANTKISDIRRFIKNRKCHCKTVCLSQVNMVNSISGNLFLLKTILKR
jgi:radical SAM protein with 4Fe4S-binding SPASM domain